jgi:hypothetical protein
VLRLVRSHSYVLTLGLGLVASEVCIPLDHRCLRALCLYSARLVSLARPNFTCRVAATMYKGNKTRDVSAGSLIVKTAGSDPREACQKAHRRHTCMWGRLKAFHGVTRPGAWPLRGLPRGSNNDQGSLRASRYLSIKPELSTGVHMSTSSLTSAFILQSWLCALPFLA